MTTADLAGPVQRLFVVVPCYNEVRGIAATLDALMGQSDPDFELVVVDNASDDGSPAIVESCRLAHGAARWHCIDEPQKGTGAAADTGFRYAIAAGATHIARTDADCLPRVDWTANLKRAFAEGAEFVAGAVHFRSDGRDIGWPRRAVLESIGAAMGAIAPFLPHNRGRNYKVRYIMVSGGNLATTAALYVASGGFPRIQLEDDNEDRLLMNRVRRVTAKIIRDRSVVVAQSPRRVLRYGIVNTILWYWGRRYRPKEVDVR